MTIPTPPSRSGQERGDHLADDLENSRREARVQGRRALGITGDADVPSLKDVVKGSNAGWYPIVALGTLISVNQFQSSGLTILGPEIAQSLGVGVATIAGLFALNNLAVALGTLPLAALAQHRPRRAVLSIIAAFSVALATFTTGFAVSAAALAVFIIWEGASSGSVRGLHQPLLFDTYPPGGRARLLSIYVAALWLSFVLGPALVGLLSWLNLTWRGTFVVMGGVMLIAACVAVRLRDPGFGRWEGNRLRTLGNDQVKIEESARAASGASTELTFFDSFRRLLLISTIRRLLIGLLVLGMMIAPLATFTSFYLEERWHLGPEMRALNGVISAGVSVPVVLVGGRVIERMFRVDPARVVKLAGVLLGGGMATILVGVLVPSLPVVIIALAAGNAAVAFTVTAIGMTSNSIIPSRMRVHLGALSNIMLSGAGGLLGQVFLAGMYARSGPTVAIAALMVPATVAAIVLYTCSRTVNSDVDAILERSAEEKRLEDHVSHGHELPMLSCRGVNFSYGNLQVLFDVSFTLADGEMVCLLGTNGAGKSTLLKVISGHGLPSRGEVRLDGADITYLDPLRRLKLGVVHIPGGHGTFGDLTVVDNLRAFGHGLGRNRKAIESKMDIVFDSFPRLAERKDMKAVTLSGGEAQMLGLARALILQPRILIIDELSLGLAPRIVGELLAMVKKINDAGTAVILVEQSVNIALSLVDHAYFMEKGEMKFDGSATDLLKRSDLLRSVFLKGAAQAVERR